MMYIVTINSVQNYLKNQDTSTCPNGIHNREVSLFYLQSAVGFILLSLWSKSPARFKKQV